MSAAALAARARGAGAQGEEDISQVDPEATGPASPRPIIVQIDNDPRARPSSALGAARIVYEYTAEGGVTRFSAIYTADQQDVGLIGNVRSGRLATIEITQEFNGILAYHGGATGIQERIWDSWIDFISFELEENYRFFTRTRNRAAPYNSYTDLRRIRAAARQKGIPLLGRGLQTFPVGDYTPPPDWAAPANRIYLPYQNGFQVLYEWDPASNAYWRTMGGRTHYDEGLRAPITTQNVVVQFVPTYLTDIVEDIYGSRSLDYGLQGEGPAWVFRDGYWVEANWQRGEGWHFTTFYDAEGNQISFAPGSVWISLVAPDAPVEFWNE
ncbi:MAG: hypothetical protein AVDCRST_MAG77-5549 [uncultured Chloroflexi bacterium]|uniref:DUF3048 domain-containing protein n=1 Tax=uncultured Chloroflexota bacterium TaxID=166587 RepID=A0A6J4KB33_9CHLR|nr:MAG: hypothetical protein AVDCRST_MAG77-5549 [uncultured Chloroflexota bacterium]